MNIIIAEDNEDARLILEKTLLSAGHNVRTASNGIEALQLTRDAPPDMIISDILMPEMDGFTFCREIKSDRALHTIPFIFYTATYTDKKDEELALSLGASRFIIKPVSSEIFLKEIDNVVGEHQNKKLIVPIEPTRRNEEICRMYNEALVRKLEKKIEDLEKSKVALEESYQKYYTLFNNSNDAIYLLHPDSGKILECNCKAAEITGYTIEELKNMHAYDLHPDEEKSMGPEIIEKIYDKTVTDIKGLHHQKKDGTLIPAEINASIISCGGMEYNLTIVRDMTERQVSEEKEKSLQSQLIQAQKMESIGRLAGGIAHDFNNMLSTIIGYSELGLLELPEGHPISEGLEAIRDAGEKAAGLTKQLLAFSRKQLLEMALINLNNAIDGMANMISRLIGEDIKLEVKLKAENVNINADISQIQQILMNLAVNARDSMPTGGHLQIKTEDSILSENDILGHRNMNPGPHIMLSVSDNGSGMSQPVMNQIFEPFFTTKEIGKGTGLGLATVYGIVKQHNGKIVASSEKGKGTTFSIHFPVAVGIDEQIKTIKSKKHPTGRETIMVVEDEEQLRGLIVDVLTPLGYTVLTANSGEEAIEISYKKSGSIDLYILDLVMAGMDGAETALVLLDKNPDTKIIFMTGYTDEVITSKLLSDDRVLLNKPFSPHQLSVVLRHTLDNSEN